MQIGDVIKAARTRAGLRQKPLGQACGWDDAQPRVSNYENGIREPSIADLIRIAKACNTTATEMVAQVEGIDLRLKFGAQLAAGTETYVVSKRAALIARGYDDSIELNRDVIDRILEIRPSDDEARTRDKNNEPTKNEKTRRSNRAVVQNPESK